MKYNRTLAIIVTVVMVAAAVFLGLQGKPVSRDNSLYITDKAGVVSAAGEDTFVQLQQAASPRLSVAVVKSTGKLSTAAYCEALWNNWNLGTSDMLLLMVTGKQDYYFGYDTGSSFAYTLDANFDTLMERYLEPDFAAGDYEQAILTFSNGIRTVLAGSASGHDPYYPDEYYGEYFESGSSFSIMGVIIVVAFLVFLIAVVSAGSVGRRRTVGRTVYRTTRPVTPPPPRPRTTSRPMAPPPAARPRTTIRTSTRPRSTGGFGGGSRPRSGGFGGGGRSGGFGGGGRSGGMRGGGRR